MQFIRRMAKGLRPVARSSEIGRDRGSLAALPAPAPHYLQFLLPLLRPPSPGGNGCICNRVTRKKK